jgi:hypothetical protein
VNFYIDEARAERLEEKASFTNQEMQTKDLELIDGKRDVGLVGRKWFYEYTRMPQDGS